MAVFVIRFTCEIERTLGSPRRSVTIAKRKQPHMTLSRSRIGRTGFAVAAAVGALVGVGGVAAPQSASAAGTPGCVSRAEYRQARKGMTPIQLRRIFGAAGKILGSGNFGGYRYVDREYRPCTSRYGTVYVSFSNDGPRTPVVLDSKFVMW